ncbi:MAG: hypothetical protein FJ387_01260 [Verrucomicrobia bacterium]|nr:hypothetical protein [Verrucomicrobiota bacterium]
MLDREYVTLQEGDEAQAWIAPGLGGWLLRYRRRLPGQGWVDALHYSQAIVERYPREMHMGNPILFPLVSFNHLPDKDHHYEWQGRRYEMPQHGFARRSKWMVLDATPTSLTMELADGDHTRSQYPFAFSHRLTYRLLDGRLLWDQEIENRSSESLPFSTGFHPYFPLPLTPKGRREECFVAIPDSRRLTMHGRGEHFSAKPFPAQNWSVQEDVSGTLFFGDLKPREALLVDPISELEVALNWENAAPYRFLAVWSKAVDEPSYCLEPWTALSNAFTRVKDHELILLEPGKTFSAAFSLELRPLA